MQFGLSCPEIMDKRWLSVCCNRVEPFPPNKIFCGAYGTCIKMIAIMQQEAPHEINFKSCAFKP